MLSIKATAYCQALLQAFKSATERANSMRLWLIALKKVFHLHPVPDTGVWQMKAIALNDSLHFYERRMLPFSEHTCVRPSIVPGLFRLRQILCLMFVLYEPLQMKSTNVILASHIQRLGLLLGMDFTGLGLLTGSERIKTPFSSLISRVARLRNTCSPNFLRPL